MNKIGIAEAKIETDRIMMLCEQRNLPDPLLGGWKELESNARTEVNSESLQD